MALTRDFKETVQARARRDAAFREGLLKEGVDCLLSGDVDTGKVQQGVELLPLKNKIFSGWYDKVAVRKLKGLSDQERRDLFQKLLEVCCMCLGSFR